MKKSELRLMIRKIVREEVALSIKEVISEMVKPTQSKPIQEKQYTKNSVLNNVLNETANDGDWKTVGGSKFTSERMNELVGGNYSDMMNDTSNTNGNLANSMGVDPNDPSMDFLKKDYRAVMKAMDKKQGK